MIFKELTIENFGIYKGKHIIDLTVEKGKPIILLGGLNGGGKTTFLDALQLVLYGKYAKCSNRGHHAYSTFLSGTKNRFGNEEDIVELSLSFQHKSSSEYQTFKVVRNWQVKNNVETKDKVQVFSDGEIDEHLSQHWDEFVNEFIPLSLSDLFFFDGEKIENLADPERSAELVKIGIENLLGLDLLNQLHIDLSLIDKKRKTENTDKNIIIKINECEDEIEKLNTSISGIKIELAGLEKQSGNTNVAINKARQVVRNSGAHLIEERDNIKFELGAIESSISLNNAEKIKLASGVGPLKLVSNLINETKKQIRLEQQCKQAIILNEAINEYESNILDTLSTAKASKRSQDQVKAKMTELSKKREELTSVECYINHDINIFSGLTERIASEKQELKKINKNTIKLEEMRTLYEKKLETIPEYETVKHLLSNLAELEGEFKGLHILIEQKKLQLEQYDAKSNVIATRYSSLLSKQNKDTFEQKRTIQVSEHINALQHTLQSFGQKLIADNIESLELLIKEKFLSLGRKKHLLSRLTISQENFEITLFDAKNEPIAPNKLSAGERQLLAIAILWGLSEASGKELPTVIDTPLGRLDSNHRANLLSKYFTNISKQVILLSTDEEINGQYYKKIKPAISQEYSIIYNERKKSSCINKGYF